MKRPHRDFVVEIKPSRRLVKSKSNSIWGSVDLKAHSAEVKSQLREGNDRSVVQNPVHTQPASDDASLDVRTETRETPSGQAVSSEASEPLDTVLADAQRPTNIDGSSEVRAALKRQPKKATVRQRKPAASRVAQLNDSTSDTLGGRTVKSTETRRRKPRKNSGEVPTGTAHQQDLDKDLAGLEAENKRLKKLFADKLHTENAELKRKLSLL